jgi:multicomponent Na+:H+ antiporter subunit E
VIGVVRERVQPFPLLWLTVVWTALWRDLSPGNVLAGALLGAFVLVVFPLPRLVVDVRVHPAALAVLVARFLADVVRASLQVTRLAVGPGTVPPGSIVTVPLRSRDELFQTVTAQLVSLVPGSVVVELDSPRGLLSVHVLAAATPAAVEAARANVLAQEDRVLRALAAHPPGERPAAAPAGPPGEEKP